MIEVPIFDQNINPDINQVLDRYKFDLADLQEKYANLWSGFQQVYAGYQTAIARIAELEHDTIGK